jgi:hypothetical protein
MFVGLPELHGNDFKPTIEAQLRIRLLTLLQLFLDRVLFQCTF